MIHSKKRFWKCLLSGLLILSLTAPYFISGAQNTYASGNTEENSEEEVKTGEQANPDTQEEEIQESETTKQEESAKEDISGTDESWKETETEEETEEETEGEETEEEESSEETEDVISQLTAGESEEENHKIKAVLYNDGAYSQEWVSLTEDGEARAEGWEFNTSKYLQIDLDVPNDQQGTHVVTVKLPNEIYAAAAEITAPDGYRDVTFTENDPIPVNRDSQYRLEEGQYSGTFQYVLNENLTGGSIQMELRYSNALWDKQEGSRLTKEGVSPISVTLSHEEEDGTLTPVKELSLKEATAGKAMKYDSSGYYFIDQETAQNTGAVRAREGQIVSVSGILLTQVYGDQYLYYENAVLQITLPAYTDGEGKKHYLKPDIEKIKFGNFPVGGPDIEVDQSRMDEGILLISFQAPYWRMGEFVRIPMSFPSEELKSEERNAFDFTGGSLTLKGTGRNGAENSRIYSRDLPMITYERQAQEDVILTGSGREVTVTDRPENAVSHLGGFYLENKGTGDSCEKIIKEEFDTGDTGLFGVTTVNLFADTLQETIKIKYTMVDENGTEKVSDGEYALKNSRYGSGGKDNLYNTFSRSMLPEEQQNYYFKSVEYRIQTIRTGAKLYANLAQASVDGSGNFFGYPLMEAKEGEKVSSSLSIRSENPDIKELNRSVSTSFSNKSTPSYTIENVKMSESGINAGESVSVSGQVKVTAYPYGNSTWIKNIRLGLVLPEGVSVNEQSVAASFANKEIAGDRIKISRRNLNNGTWLWVLAFPEEVNIGYLTETLKALENGTSMDFSLQLDTDINMDKTTLYASDILFVAGKGQENSAGGAYSWASKADSYDLNENGRTDDRIGGMQVSSSIHCSIAVLPAVLKIEDSVSVIRGDEAGDWGDEAALMEEEDTVSYQLNIDCDSSGSANDFYYFIPIPKISSGRDHFLVTGNAEDSFNFDLMGAAQIEGSQFYTVAYAVQEGLTYDGAREDSVAWYTADEIQSSGELDWSYVTMIKLTAENGKITSGENSRITVQMKYGGDNYPEEAGMTNVWNSCGHYTYAIGNRTTTGDYPTDGCRAVLNYSWSNEERGVELELTAAKDMNPTPPNVNVQTLDESFLGENMLPAFKNQQTFSITKVETTNAILRTKDYMQENAETLPGYYANQYFGITVQMEGGPEVNALSSAGQKPAEVGTSESETAPVFTVRLYNADALSDLSTERYAVITMTSDKGVTVQIKVDIQRELAKADANQSAIVAGKQYVATEESTKEIEISRNSAATAQFVVEDYIPVNYGEVTLNFSETLPKGTTVIMANVTDAEHPSYWHYTLNGQKKEAALSEFNCMGTQNEEYVYETGENSMTARILMVVDFSQCESYPGEGEYRLWMEFKGIRQQEDLKTEELTIITEKARTFELFCQEEAPAEEEVSVQYLMHAPGVSESKYAGRRLSLVIYPDSETPLPKDAYIQIKDTEYSLNSSDQFIIPWDNVQGSEEIVTEQSGTITLRLCSEMFPDEGKDYQMHMELWASATGNAQTPFLGEKEAETSVNFKAERKLQPSLKVKDMSSRVLHLSDLGKDIRAEFEYIPDTDCKVTVELQRKSGQGYAKVTDVLTSVNGSTGHKAGVFPVEAKEGKNTLNFILSPNTAKQGTYRLVFGVSDGNGKQLLEIPYNFIVAD